MIFRFFCNLLLRPLGVSLCFTVPDEAILIFRLLILWVSVENHVVQVEFGSKLFSQLLSFGGAFRGKSATMRYNS